MKIVCWINEDSREISREQPKCWNDDKTDTINDPSYKPLTYYEDASRLENAFGMMRSGSSSVTIHSPTRFFDDEKKKK